jgi:hypothetical protein
MQDKGGDIPAHSEQAGGQPQDSSAIEIYFTKIFRRQKERISSKYLREIAVHCTKKYGPENDQYLVLAKMQQKQLYREGIIDLYQQKFHFHP